MRADYDWRTRLTVAEVCYDVDSPEIFQVRSAGEFAITRILNSLWREVVSERMSFSCPAGLAKPLLYERLKELGCGVMQAIAGARYGQNISADTLGVHSLHHLVGSFGELATERP